MNTQETIDLLYNLKLKGMSEAYKAMTIMPVSERPDMDMAIAKLAEAERRYRDNQKTQMQLKHRGHRVLRGPQPQQDSIIRACRLQLCQTG